MNKKDYRLVGSLDSKDAMENLINDLKDTSNTYSKQHLELGTSSQIRSYSQPISYAKRPLLEENKKAAKFKYNTCDNVDKLQMMKEPRDVLAATTTTRNNTLSVSRKTDLNNKYENKSCQSRYAETSQPSERNQSQIGHLRNYSSVSKKQSSQVKRKYI